MKLSAFVTLFSKTYKTLEPLGILGLIRFNSFLQNYLDNHIDLLLELQSYGKNKVAVLATNGKKTTASLFNSILTMADQKITTNVTQDSRRLPFYISVISNMKKKSLGASKIDDFEQADFFTMAFDEDEILGYFQNTKFDYLLLNNLFIDQKDYSTLDEKRKKIQGAILLNPKLNLVVNADEPMFFQIDAIKNDSCNITKRKKFFYGFESVEYADGRRDLDQKNDLLICPRCLCRLEYEKNFYSHLGHYSCDCGFKRPKPDLSAKVKVFQNYSLLTTYYKDTQNVFKIPVSGLDNAYNALSAIALGLCLNIERKIISKALETYKPIKARSGFVDFKNKKAKVKIIKNPTSLSQALREVPLGKTKIVICINDEKIDGVDTSWIFNSNAKSLETFENKIYVTANRFDDAALWLKYQGVNPCLIVMEQSVKTTLECCYYELEEGENFLILATPSCVDEVLGILEK